MVLQQIKNMAARWNLIPHNSEERALEERGYHIGKKIGQGSYAKVYTSYHIDDKSRKKTRLACKIFDKDKAPKGFLEKFLPRELEILTKIENAHIIHIHSILQRGPRVFIFMRYAENGDLLNFIQKMGAVPGDQAKIWFRQMTNGLNYLHENNIAHRDLKCENILLSQRFNAKIADFGFARFCTDRHNASILCKTYCGSASYAAPEIIKGTPYNPKLSDIWSLGIILFVMLNAVMPFDDSNIKKLLNDQISKKWVFQSKIDDIPYKLLVSNLLEPDVHLRLTLDRIIQHDWLKESSHSSQKRRNVQSAPHSQSINFGKNRILDEFKIIEAKRSIMT